MTRVLSIGFFLLLLSLVWLAPAEGSARPFPQHTPYHAGTIRPNHQSQSQTDADVLSYYLAWKSALFKSAFHAARMGERDFQGTPHPSSAESKFSRNSFQADSRHEAVHRA